MSAYNTSNPVVVATATTFTPPANSNLRVVILAGVTSASTTFAATGMTTVTIAANAVLPYNPDAWFVGPPGVAVLVTGTGVFNVTMS